MGPPWKRKLGIVNHPNPSQSEAPVYSSKVGERNSSFTMISYKCGIHGNHMLQANLAIAGGDLNFP